MLHHSPTRSRLRAIGHSASFQTLAAHGAPRVTIMMKLTKLVPSIMQASRENFRMAGHERTPWAAGRGFSVATRECCRGSGWKPGLSVAVTPLSGFRSPKRLGCVAARRARQVIRRLAHQPGEHGRDMGLGLKANRQRQVRGQKRSLGVFDSPVQEVLVPTQAGRRAELRREMHARLSGGSHDVGQAERDHSCAKQDDAGTTCTSLSSAD